MRRRKKSKARNEQQRHRLKLRWKRRGRRGRKERNELRRLCRDKGQAKRIPTHRDRDTSLDRPSTGCYSTGCTQTLSAAETHPKATEAPQLDMGTGPNTQEYQAAGGNGGVSVTRMRIPRNRKSAVRVITQSFHQKLSGACVRPQGAGRGKRLDSAHPAVLGAPPPSYAPPCV